ncbi:hypothetical protein GYMLUDRAFT_59419 [Collybiopsis luxurians FD-317 M1]|uniref:Uncharacterized protein n=1 Tax=Collybiopsis luxurians FD-317 M1 TaxID=944289 RepID=A0A0D0CPC1_9AGAR|nr:hypothetical protein GYMLUDRAFT_59419 [Collybiopsis luxurians FD-317 M1]
MAGLNLSQQQIQVLLTDFLSSPRGQSLIQEADQRTSAGPSGSSIVQPVVPPAALSLPLSLAPQILPPPVQPLPPQQAPPPPTQPLPPQQTLLLPAQLLSQQAPPPPAQPLPPQDALPQALQQGLPLPSQLLLSQMLPSQAPTFPFPPPSCHPYTTVQMLADMADRGGPSGVSLGGGSVGIQGHPHSPFDGFSWIQCSNQKCVEHARESIPPKPMKEKKQGSAVRPPALAQRVREASVDDCILLAEGGEEVVNLVLMIYPPWPPARELKVCG